MKIANVKFKLERTRLLLLFAITTRSQNHVVDYTSWKIKPSSGGSSATQHTHRLIGVTALYIRLYWNFALYSFRLAYKHIIMYMYTYFGEIFLFSGACHTTRRVTFSSCVTANIILS